jgi:hypothetical protein
MIHMLTAFTEELDDAGLAVSQILAQLDLKRSLLRHAAGIIQCSTFFVEAGVVRALCAALPFEVIGCTTLGAATRGAGGTFVLALCVLTSDEVTFAAGVSEPIRDCPPDGPVERLYAKLAAALPEKPVLSFLFDLFTLSHTGDELLRKLTGLSGNAPFFGMRAIDNTSEHAASSIISNGECLPHSIALLAMAGDMPDPVFLVKTAAETRMLEQSAVITEAEGNRLRTVNGVPAMQYFASLGLVQQGMLLGNEILLFVLKGQDDVLPRVCRLCANMDAAGDIVCGGEMPVGERFTITIIDPRYILSSARELAAEAARLARGRNALFVSCSLRSWVLGLRDQREMEIVAECCGRSPYLLSYAGGEFFPFRKATGEWIHQFHNAALGVCIF